MLQVRHFGDKRRGGRFKKQLLNFQSQSIFFRNGSRLLAETTATAEKAFLFRRRQTTSTSSSSTEIMAASATTRCYVAKLFYFTVTTKLLSYSYLLIESKLVRNIPSPTKQLNLNYNRSSGLPVKNHFEFTYLYYMASHI